jgi:RNA polymerase sigma-70 factor (ECF subfamily)
MNAPDADDSIELMLRLQRGDDLALNALMDRWQKPLVAFIQRYTGNEQDALDLAQETFVRIYETRARYQPSAKFSTFLFTIAGNLCRNLARWRARHPAVSLNTAAEGSETLETTLPDTGDSPADSAERHDLASAVREHIQSLPHDLKTAILLFEFQNLSHEEIAAALGCSPKAVETRLYRARKILRETLSRWKLT